LEDTVPLDHGDIPSILFGILFYSDKSKLSSFGSVKGWPVLTCALPLPLNIRNSKGHGGVCLVGWLPYVGSSSICCPFYSNVFQVDEESEHKGKPYWADFKHNLYHCSMERIFELIIGPSWYGMVINCADNKACCIFPFIQDISADTEES